MPATWNILLHSPIIYEMLNLFLLFHKSGLILLRLLNYCHLCHLITV